MRLFFLALLSCFFFFSSNAKGQIITNIDLKEVNNIGTYRAFNSVVKFDIVVETTSVGSSGTIHNSKFKRIRITAPTNKGEQVFLLFEKDAEQFSKDIGILIELKKKYAQESKEYIELSTTSKDGLKLGFFQKVQQQTDFIFANKEMLIPSTKEDFALIKSLLEECIKALSQK